MKDLDIVAGAGIWGCTVARRQAEAGCKVLVLEKRPVVVDCGEEEFGFCDG